MAEFYRMPHWLLTGLVMVLALCIVLQTRAVSYSIRRLRTGWVRGVETGMECAILGGFVPLRRPSRPGAVWAVLRLFSPQRLWLCPAAGISAGSGAGHHRCGGNGVDLALFRCGWGGGPASLDGGGHRACVPVLLPWGVLFFLIRSVHICLLRRRELHTQISFVSVKEAIDTLHTGLLLFRPKGDILLCNRRMDMLAQQMTGAAVPERQGI